MILKTSTKHNNIITEFNDFENQHNNIIETEFNDFENQHNNIERYHINKKILALVSALQSNKSFIAFSSSRTSDGQSSLADKCCSPLQIREAAVELLGLQSWLGPGPHSQFFIQFTPL